MRRHTNFRSITLFTIFLMLGVSVLVKWNLRIREAIFLVVMPIFRLGNWHVLPQKNDLQLDEKSRLADMKIKQLEEEIDTLHRILEVKEELKTKSRVARVALFIKELNREVLILNEGAEAGIELGEIVVDSQKFVVGTVREVGQNYAKVSFASNIGEAYEVGFLPLHANALARGAGNRTISVELIPANFSLRKGDFIALSGFGNETFLLGEIVREESTGGTALKKARALLLSSPENLEEVIILEGKKTIGVK